MSDIFIIDTGEIIDGYFRIDEYLLTDTFETAIAIVEKAIDIKYNNVKDTEVRLIHKNDDEKSAIWRIKKKSALFIYNGVIHIHKADICTKEDLNKALSELSDTQLPEDITEKIISN